MKVATQKVSALARPVARLIDAATSDPTLTILGWHRIGDAPDGITTTLDDFRAHLDVLDEWGAEVLPLTQAHALLRSGELPPKAVVLTFDDGYSSSIELGWGILRDRGLPATLFAVSGYLDGRSRFPWDIAWGVPDDISRLATAAQIVEAAGDGLDIGSHTVTHQWLPKLPSSQVVDEVLHSRHELEDLLGSQVSSFAYPMGGWNSSIRESAVAAGYDIAITVDRGRNAQRQDPHALRRSFAFDSADDFRRQLEGAYNWMRPIETVRLKTKDPHW